MEKYTELLYAKPSTIEGFARTLDLGGTFDSYNESRTPREADQLADAADWYAVGSDLRRAFRRFAERIDRKVTRVARSGK